MGFLLCARTIIIYFQCTEHFAPIRFVITAIDSITPAHNKLTKVPASRKTPVQNPVPHPPLVDIIIIHIRAPGLTPPGWQKRHMAWSSRHIHFPGRIFCWTAPCKICNACSHYTFAFHFNTASISSGSASI